MHRVSRKEHATFRIPLGNQASALPYTATDPVNIERLANRALNKRVSVNRLRRLLAIAVDHHQPPHRVDRIDDANVGPQTALVDGKQERALCLANTFQEIRRSEKKMDRMAEDALSREPDAKFTANCAVRADATDQIVCFNYFAQAGFKINDFAPNPHS